VPETKGAWRLVISSHLSSIAISALFNLSYSKCTLQPARKWC
jgi:hypothetical protein